MLWECEEQDIKPRFFLHDNDASFSEDFDLLLKNSGVEPVKTPFHAPNANSVAERYILSARSKDLNHIIFFDLDQLQRTLDKYQEFFNKHRPHQGIGNTIPYEFDVEVKSAKAKVVGRMNLSQIHRKEFLGGLLKSYYRKVA